MQELFLNTCHIPQQRGLCVNKPIYRCKICSPFHLIRSTYGAYLIIGTVEKICSGKHTSKSTDTKAWPILPRVRNTTDYYLLTPFCDAACPQLESLCQGILLPFLSILGWIVELSNLCSIPLLLDGDTTSACRSTTLNFSSLFRHFPSFCFASYYFPIQHVSFSPRNFDL
jgi:hypothetical protein